MNSYLRDDIRLYFIIIRRRAIIECALVFYSTYKIFIDIHLTYYMYSRLTSFHLVGELKCLFVIMLLPSLYLQIAQAAGLTEEMVSKSKQSRSEKKARKAMSKLGNEMFFTRIDNTMRYLYACTTISPIFMENKNTDKNFKNSVFDIAPSLGVLSLVLNKKGNIIVLVTQRSAVNNVWARSRHDLLCSLYQ